MTTIRDIIKESIVDIRILQLRRDMNQIEDETVQEGVEIILNGATQKITEAIKEITQ